MIPEYLTLNEAASWLSQKSGSMVPVEWLFQYASAEKLQLFALLRRGVILEYADRDRFLPSEMYEQGHRLPLDVKWAKALQGYTLNDFMRRPVPIHVYQTEKGVGYFTNIVGGQRSPLEFGLQDLCVRSVDLEKFVHGTDKRQGESLSPGERTTVLKLILGMALSCYKYDPQAKFGVAKQIETDLLAVGISATDDTIRKWLNEAKDRVSYKLPGK